MPNKRAQRAPPSEKLKPRPVNVRFYAMIGSTPTCEPSSMLLIRVATLTNHWILYLANRHLTCMQREAQVCWWHAAQRGWPASALGVSTSFCRPVSVGGRYGIRKKGSGSGCAPVASNSSSNSLPVIPS